MNSHSDALRLSPSEALLVVAICFGWFIVVSTGSLGDSDAYFGLTNQNAMEMVVWELLAGAMAVLVLRRRGYPIASLYPTPSFSGIIHGLLLYLAWVFSASLVLLPLFHRETFAPIEQMLEDSTIGAPPLILFALVNGAFEEIFLLAVLQRGLGHLGVGFAIGVSTLVRVSYHTYQGPAGLLTIVAVGVILGLYYARTGELFAPVFAHIVADIVPFA